MKIIGILFCFFCSSWSATSSGYLGKKNAFFYDNFQTPITNLFLHRNLISPARLLDNHRVSLERSFKAQLTFGIYYQSYSPWTQNETQYKSTYPIIGETTRSHGFGIYFKNFKMNYLAPYGLYSQHSFSYSKRSYQRLDESEYPNLNNQQIESIVYSTFNYSYGWGYQKLFPHGLLLNSAMQFFIQVDSQFFSDSSIQYLLASLFQFNLGVGYAF